MKNIAWIAAAWALLGSPGLAQPWNLASCGPENAASRKSFREALVRAQPDSPKYVPHPFPQTPDQVVEDFVAYHRKAWADTPFASLPPAEQRFFAAVDEDRIRFQVTRVANWTPSRCGPKEEKDFYFLVRFFDETSGEEITRVAVDEAGHVARVAHRPEDGALPELPELEQRIHAAATAHGWKPSAGQYVALWGSFRCDEMSPCVGFRVGPRAYLLRGEHLYRIATEKPRFSVREEMATVASKRRFLDAFEGGPEKVITLGHDVMAVAVPVPP